MNTFYNIHESFDDFKFDEFLQQASEFVPIIKRYDSVMFELTFTQERTEFYLFWGNTEQPILKPELQVSLGQEKLILKNETIYQLALEKESQ